MNTRRSCTTGAVGREATPRRRPGAMDATSRTDRRTVMVDGPDGAIEVHAVGAGPTVVLLPSLGRPASDFDELAVRLAGAGFLALAPEPRGVGRSTGPLEDLTLAALAGDVVQ